MKRPRLLVGGVFAGFAILALLAVLIFQFGRHDPSPPSLQDKPNPEIPGEVIYLESNSCITRIDASGANRREIVCTGRVDFVARLDDRTIVYGSYGPAGSPATQRDLVTGQETVYPAGTTPEKFPIGAFPGDQRSVLGEYITIDPDGSVFRSNTTEPGRTLIFDCDCAEYRAPQFYTWSPDGQWVMLVYMTNNSPGQELWILARDGSSAGTLATVGYNANASWFIEGKGILPKSTLTPVAR
ncbi:MAG: hypothetical protein ABI782_08405 [Anaerolineaceae bacterium]